MPSGVMPSSAPRSTVRTGPSQLAISGTMSTRGAWPMVISPTLRRPSSAAILSPLRCDRPVHQRSAHSRPRALRRQVFDLSDNVIQLLDYVLQATDRPERLYQSPVVPDLIVRAGVEAPPLRLFSSTVRFSWKQQFY